jgi:uncharacterized protein (DUF1330 family)
MLMSHKAMVIALGGLSLLGAGYAAGAASAPTPKGYMIAEATVTDPEGMKPYAAATPALIAKFGGRYVVRGGRTVGLEGAPPASRVVIVEFPSLEAAQAYFHSPEYQAILPYRQKSAVSRSFLAEGFAP